MGADKRRVLKLNYTEKYDIIGEGINVRRDNSATRDDAFALTRRVAFADNILICYRKNDELYCKVSSHGIGKLLIFVS